MKKIGLILQLIGFFILYSLPSMLLMFRLLMPLEIGPVFVVGLSVLILAVVACFIYYGKKQGWLGQALPDSQLIFRWVGLGLLSIFISNFIHVFLIAGLEGRVTTDNQAIIEQLMGTVPSHLQFIMFLIIVISAPICEEILFRGLLAYGIFAGYERLGLAVAAVLFGFAHTSGDFLSWSTPLYVSMGAILSWVRYRSGRLELSILTHLIWNLLGFVMLMLMR